ncbi:DUF58 domain-containing protein [Isoptericola sp. NEAU-Y5]|uniref:DUF58 domain-containing protein n=1 Tax=Isoptericola luteus TaxID=2879484 RepID=A0ABS7ZJQ9_9MICO|nr:DUF58 domain-containing protein [Isoptericola sp. NEAU-Y5]MCA5894757.1 DUF58 domain-containing protein [Isoptericola sp. NEAU-Y5]
MTTHDAAAVWDRSSHTAAGIAAGVLVLGLGLLVGRADVAIMAVPLLLSAGWAGMPGAWRARPPEGTVHVSAESDDRPREPGRLAGVVHLDPPPGTELVQVRVTGPGHRPVVAVVAGEPRTLEVCLRTVRTGPQRTFRIHALGAGAGGTTVPHAPVTATAPDRVVLPAPLRLGQVPLPSRLRGLTGPHTARRLGDGDELRDIHPFTPGDRLRRVDWRTTARRSPELETLYVRRTYATAEATAVLVLDSRDDVGPDLRTWRGSGTQRVDEPTSLDLARNAAASVAAALVAGGDRVGLEDLGRSRRPVPAAAGRRQLRRVLHGLALSRAIGTPARRLRPPQVPADAIVYLFTTALDDESLGLVRAWRAGGHPVVVVDTLPDVRAVAEEHMRLAWRVTRLEREDRLRHMGAEGVPVVRWAGTARDEAPVRLETLVRAAQRHGGMTAAAR